MPQPTAPIPVFCSFAPEDEPLYLELEKHLKLLQRQQLLSTWHTRRVLAGTDWASAVDAHLDSAALILLLISVDFLASDYCYGIELQRAMQRHQAGTTRVIPILLRPADRTAAPFAPLAVLPTNEQPITLWDNRDQAFADVVAGIRRAISDLPTRSLGPSPIPSSQVWTIPYPRNPVFTGGEALLAHLATQLQAGQTMALTQPPQAISGLGGVGKTQLAVEYAYRHRGDYQAVLWARAESTEALTSSCLALAQELNLPQKTEQDASLVVAALQRWLRTNTGWLLILDNANDLAVVRTFLPPDYKGHVLLTSRAQAMGRLAQRLDVDSLSAELGALFLLRRAGRLAPTASLDQASLPDREDAYAITRELGGLPLALDQAGAYIEETGCSLADYRQFYHQHRADLLKRRCGQVADHPEAVVTTWSLAFERLEQAQPAVVDLLRLCAFLAPDAIPEELLTQGAAHLGPLLAPVAADPFRLNQALEALRAYSLIQRDATSKTLTVHRLVQAVLQDAMTQEEQQVWSERMVQLVRAAFPAVEFANSAACERCLPHAQACLPLVEGDTIPLPQAAQVLAWLGWYLIERGRYRQAEVPLRQALAWRERHLGAEHLETSQSLSFLARLYRRQGEYEQAEQLYQRALAICEAELESTHPDTATGLNNLAAVYASQGKYKQAEPLYERALAIYEAQLRPTHSLIATSLNDLGGLYRRQGKYEQAEPLYERALAICEAHLGPTHPHTATNLNHLALLYVSQGKYEQAEPLFQRAMTICEQQLGPEHPHTRIVQGNYVRFLRALGRDTEADQVEARKAR